MSDKPTTPEPRIARRVEPSAYLCPPPGAPRLADYVKRVDTSSRGVLAQWQRAVVFPSLWNRTA